MCLVIFFSVGLESKAGDQVSCCEPGNSESYCPVMMEKYVGQSVCFEMTEFYR